MSYAGWHVFSGSRVNMTSLEKLGCMMGWWVLCCNVAISFPRQCMGAFHFPSIKVMENKKHHTTIDFLEPEVAYRNSQQVVVQLLGRGGRSPKNIPKVTNTFFGQQFSASLYTPFSFRIILGTSLSCLSTVFVAWCDKWVQLVRAKALHQDLCLQRRQLDQNTSIFAGKTKVKSWWFLMFRGAFRSFSI